jgi:hypothetical protein
VVPNAAESGISQLGRAIFGGRPSLYPAQAGTTLILVLAANTAYADFPRLASIVSRDRTLPRQFMNARGRPARLLEWHPGALDVRRCPHRGVPRRHAVAAPLYMIGVFVSFTLSQAGMVIHWRRTERRAEDDAVINRFGAVVTGIVLIIVAVCKTLEGAWIVLLIR